MNSDPFLLFHTYADHVMDQTLDPFETAKFLIDQKLFNGIMVWVDHHKKPIAPPPAEWLKANGLAVLFEFYTNDHYAVPCAAMEGFGDDLTGYNEHWCRTILEYQRDLGPGRSFWCLGHEHYDSFQGYPQSDETGQIKTAAPQSLREAFDLYREWVSTNQHQVHWGPHRYATLPGYKQGRMTDQAETMAFLRDRGQSIPYGLMRGGVKPQHAHYQFEIFPDQEAFWWECMNPGLMSIQVGMSFLRGAVRQYGRKILADVAPYEHKRAWHEDLERDKPLAQEFLNYLTWTCYDDQDRRLAGFSESLHLRVWMSMWTGGVDMMLHEDSISTHLPCFGRKTALSPLGRTHARFAELALDRAKDRGTPIPAAAVVLPFLQGMCPGIADDSGQWPGHFLPRQGMAPDEMDWLITRFFNAAFPNHSRTFAWPYPGNPFDKNDIPARQHYGRMVRAGADMRAVEPRFMTESRWGNGIDVLLDNASLEILRRYPALILFEADSPDPKFTARIEAYLQDGGRVLRIGPNQSAPGRGFQLDPEVLAAIDAFLEPHQILKIHGPALEWNVARNEQGLRIYLANHSPVDALPIVEVRPDRCGLTPEPQSQGLELVTGSSIPLNIQDGKTAFEIFVPAWGFVLIDLPAKAK
jgi:hypothetical protein